MCPPSEITDLSPTQACTVNVKCALGEQVLFYHQSLLVACLMGYNN